MGSGDAPGLSGALCSLVNVMRFGRVSGATPSEAGRAGLGSSSGAEGCSESAVVALDTVLGDSVGVFISLRTGSGETMATKPDEEGAETPSGPRLRILEL